MVAAVLMLTACASTRPVAAIMPRLDIAAVQAALREAARPRADELDIQPLRDPQVADLQEQARMEALARHFDAAAVTLDRALLLQPGDPVLLQERAEAALMLGRATEAGRFAHESHRAGPKVGPLCRRAFEVRLQAARLASPANAPGVDALGRERDACTITPPPRY